MYTSALCTFLMFLTCLNILTKATNLYRYLKYRFSNHVFTFSLNYWKKKLNIKMLTLITLIIINSSCSLVVLVVWKLNFVISQHKYNKQITSIVGSLVRFLFTRCEEPLTQSLVPRSIVRTHLPWYSYILRWIFCLSHYLCLYPYTWNATVDWVMKKTYHRTYYIREHYT